MGRWPHALAEKARQFISISEGLHGLLDRHVGQLFGQAVNEALTLHEFFMQFVKVGVCISPLNVGETEVQIAQGTSHSNV